MATTGWFSSTAKRVSRFTGGALCFLLALGSVVVWAVTGPIFGYSQNWQMVMNTGTSIITFLMVFLIQSSQNRDTEAIQIKLDELIRVNEGAHNTLMGVEELEPTHLEKVHGSFVKLAERAKDASDPSVPERGIPKVDIQIPSGENQTGGAATDQRTTES